MTNEHQKGNRSTNRIRWIARIWGMLIILIVLMVLIGNVLGPEGGDPYAREDYPFIENLPPLFIALSAVGLAIAWRWEGLGGALAVFFQLAALPFMLITHPITEDFPRFLIAPYGIAVFVAIPGVLFLICWRRSRRMTKPPESG